MRRRPGLLLMFGITVTAVSLFAQPCPKVTFSGAKEWYGGVQPRSLRFANVNRDAYPDLIVAGTDQNHVPIGGLTVLLGDGGNTWRVDTELFKDQSIPTFDLLDFDGDGDDDIVYLHLQQQQIHVLRNENGTFRERSANTPTQIYSNWGGLVAGDFNGDGRDDFALASTGIELYLSAGDGTFAYRLLSPDDVRTVTAGDLDDDGRDELIVGRNSEVLIFGGHAQTGVTDPRTVRLTYPASVVVVADIDGDAKRDVVSTRSEVVLRAGTSTPEVRFVSMDSTGGLRPAVADFNGDGLDDLVAYDWFFGVRVFAAGPGATFVVGDSFYVPRMATTGGLGPNDIDAADVDLDGDADIAIITEHGFSILKNDGSGQFDSARFVSDVLAIGDFNEDGRDDVLDGTGIRLADANGAMTRATLEEIYSASNYSWGAAADMNNDGNLDAVYYGRSSFMYGLFVRLGDGQGNLAAPAPLFRIGDGDPRSIRVADLNGDGNQDVVVSMLCNAAMAPGDGKGGFLPVVAVPGLARGIAAGDLDGDGDIDLAGDGDRGYIFYNDGTGKFGAPVKLGSTFWRFVEIADMNGDGRADIVAAAGGGGDASASVTVLVNRGGGVFEPAESAHVPLALNGIQVRDFNGDGILDVLASEGGTTASKGWMALMLGVGTGAFGAPAIMRSVSGNPILAGDFNGDGALDISDSGFVRFGQCAWPRRRAARH